MEKYDEREFNRILSRIEEEKKFFNDLKNDPCYKWEKCDDENAKEFFDRKEYELNAVCPYYRAARKFANLIIDKNSECEYVEIDVPSIYAESVLFLLKYEGYSSSEIYYEYEFDTNKFLFALC